MSGAFGSLSRGELAPRTHQVWESNGSLYVRLRLGLEQPVHEADHAGGPNVAVQLSTWRLIPGSSAEVSPADAWTDAQSESVSQLDNMSHRGPGSDGSFDSDTRRWEVVAALLGGLGGGVRGRVETS